MWAVVTSAKRTSVEIPSLPFVSVYRSTDLGSYGAFRHAFGRTFGEQITGHLDRPAPATASSVVERSGIQAD